MHHAYRLDLLAVSGEQPPGDGFPQMTLHVGDGLLLDGDTSTLADDLGRIGCLPLATVLAVTNAASMLLSDLINNAAAAVLMAPIDASLAEGLGVGSDLFLMAVGCTCILLTPIGHLSNALVFGPGGYCFGDYWRMGLPLGLIVVGAATPLVSLV